MARHRRRRLHRIASGGSADRQGRDRARRRQLHHRATAGTSPCSAIAPSSSKATSPIPRSPRAPSPAWTTCSTRRRSRRCRGRCRTRRPRIAPTSTRRCRSCSRRATPSVRRVVYAASSSAYGDTPTLPKREDMPTRPAVAVRAAEAGRRAVHAAVHVALRPRDGEHPLLQRVRPAAGSLVAVLRRDCAVRHGAAGGQAADHHRRRRADARLHVHRQRRRWRAAGGHGARRRRAR